MDDIFEQAPLRSPEFWEALATLGGTPEQVAPHLGLTEREVAERLAAARGRLGISCESPSLLETANRQGKSLAGKSLKSLNRPDFLRSNWGRGRVR